jgi:hypothetical protein
MDSVKQKAIKHYQRMIAWAEKQPPREKASFMVMDDSISESYGSINCAYCIKYKCCCQLGCPLYRRPKNLYLSVCCNGLWSKMFRSKTWGTWVKRAKKVLEYIEVNG